MAKRTTLLDAAEALTVALRAGRDTASELVAVEREIQRERAEIELAQIRAQQQRLAEREAALADVVKTARTRRAN